MTRSVTGPSTSEPAFTSARFVRSRALSMSHGRIDASRRSVTDGKAFQATPAPFGVVVRTDALTARGDEAPVTSTRSVPMTFPSTAIGSPASRRKPTAETA